MRYLFLIGLICLIVGGARAEQPFRDIDFIAAQAAASKEKKVILIDFYTTWCGPCKMLDKTTWKDAKVQALLNDKTIALKIDAEKETELAKRYRVSAYPTIMIINADGSEVDRLVGYLDPTAFLSAATDALAGKNSLMRAKEKMATAKNDPGLRMEYAEALANKGQYQEALDEYLWCFDHGLEHDQSFAGVRASFLLSSIKSLGNAYPPALDALKERRDRAEQAIFSNAAVTRANMLDLSSLNRVLGDNARTVTAFDKLTGGEAERLKKDMVDIILDQLLAAKRYQDIINYSSDVKAKVDRLVRNHESLKGNDSVNEEMMASLKSFTVRKASSYYEALLGVGKAEEAGTLLEQLLNFDASAQTYVLLIKRASVAGARETASALGARALKSLPEKDHELIRTTLAALPAK